MPPPCPDWPRNWSQIGNIRPSIWEVISDQGRGSGRRTLLRAAVTIGLFAVVVLAVDQFVPGAGHRLAEAAPGWLVVALGLELVACSAYVLLFDAVFSRM